jgi:alanine dehydrogenase
MMGSSENSGFSLEKENLMPREEMLEIAKKKKNLRIAVAKESANDENRVALAPHAVELLVTNGHEVYVEKGAGIQAHFDDLMYSEAGGTLVEDKRIIYSSDIIVKVAPFSDEEVELLRGNQLVISSFQIGTQPRICSESVAKKSNRFGL